MNKDTMAIIKALSHPLRFSIVEALIKGPTCICEFQLGTGTSQPNISQHMKILYDAGLVKAERDGTKMMYELTCPEIELLLSSLEAVRRAIS